MAILHCTLQKREGNSGSWTDIADVYVEYSELSGLMYTGSENISVAATDQSRFRVVVDPGDATVFGFGAFLSYTKRQIHTQVL